MYVFFTEKPGENASALTQTKPMLYVFFTVEPDIMCIVPTGEQDKQRVWMRTMDTEETSASTMTWGKWTMEETAFSEISD